MQPGSTGIRLGRNTPCIGFVNSYFPLVFLSKSKVSCEGLLASKNLDLLRKTKEKARFSSQPQSRTRCVATQTDSGTPRLHFYLNFIIFFDRIENFEFISMSYQYDSNALRSLWQLASDQPRGKGGSIACHSQGRKIRESERQAQGSYLLCVSKT